MRYQVQESDDMGGFDDIGQPEDTIADACALIQRHISIDIEEAEPGTDLTASWSYRIVVVA